MLAFIITFLYHFISSGDATPKCKNVKGWKQAASRLLISMLLIAITQGKLNPAKSNIANRYFDHAVTPIIDIISWTYQCIGMLWEGTVDTAKKMQQMDTERLTGVASGHGIEITVAEEWLFHAQLTICVLTRTYASDRYPEGGKFCFKVSWYFIKYLSPFFSLVP